jgi:hypothetical protein
VLHLLDLDLFDLVDEGFDLLLHGFHAGGLGLGVSPSSI